jgi:DNA mismatch repair protein MutS
MFTEYIELYQRYTQQYGPKTAIFLMVGSFYELYDIQDTETGETQANVREIVDFLGIQLSSKQADLGKGKDGLFAGFPDYVMHKWAGRLTSAGWTVVIVDQIKDMRGKVKERKVSRILSPSTHIENTSATETPYIVTLFFESQQSLQQAPQFGAAVLDLTTGTTRTYSGRATGRYDIWTADDLVQLLSVYAPKELLLYWMGDHMPEEAWIRRLFGISSTIPVHLRPMDACGSFSSALVCSEYLQQIYRVQSVLPVRTYLGLRTDQEEQALVHLLQFVEEHHPSMLRAFHRNEAWTPHTRLICGNHALTQLQMTAANPAESVLGLFDKCITPMGKRAIKERLLTPYSNAADIRARLHEVQNYMTWTEEKPKQLERQLRFMFDLPRLHRRLLCGLIAPMELANLFQSYSAIEVIMLQVTQQTPLQAPFSLQEWVTYLKVIRTHFSEEKAQQASADLTAFHAETYPDIGQKERDIQALHVALQQLRRDIAKGGGVAEDAIRLEEREKEPFGLKGSTITLQQLKKNLKNLPEGTRISELKSGGWIDCTKLQQINTSIQKEREALDRLVRMHLPDACQAVSDAGIHIWWIMEHWICHVDGTQCIGRVSKERGFSCPEIEDAEESSVDITHLRHPLVEASSTRQSYVKHHVSLGKTNVGKTNVRKTNGWLIYGMNASGKSTLMKATGICILLAQAGCFVPARTMRLSPFQAIYTRILNHDNLFAGLSSFAVEMSELRDILRHANPHTLVLGDELCAGTESISAQALVASGIQWLSKRRAKFMFATHLHDVPTLIDPQKEQVEIWHLHVEYDPMTQKLVYDRSLRPGSGSTLYGLEVARAMDLPLEFIEQALQNRHRIVGSVKQEEATVSSWNKDIIRRSCESCNSPIVSDLEVHHLQHRASAQNHILEDGTHMNDKRNLVVLCEECHDRIHAGTLVVGNIQLTSNGPERVIYQMESPIKKKGKWTDEEIETVKSTLKKYTSLSLKSIRAQLSSKYSIEMSEAILGKMRKEI